ncbi:src-like-adapter [Solea senegalensis]|uniref:Src-like-adapter n=1 Tax=Solea senegalensis TaxID=28829 RepID=A0AAV6PFK7_SOLSE|nr:src like adaptor 1a [Solea senegalensis]XP_043871726.1 src like adaptor 1a [Solea senegalensis]KAG7461409.1 src-like-adapter [Solea senegalensis]
MPTQQSNSYRLECIWRMGNMMRGLTATDKINTQNLDGSQKSLEDDTVVVVQDYPSPDISAPIYRMGEKLRVLAQEAYWWRVCSVQTGKENYIPSSHVAKVYHGWLFEGVERQKAEELLLLPVNRVGSFLVRESTSERGTYSLSVKHRSIKHYRISRLDNSWYYISPRLTFQCLEDMINHYSDTADGLCCVLTTPCLSGTTPQSDAAPPVVMRRNFDWKKVDRRQLVSTDSCSDNTVSYGVRNSIAAYLSFSESQDSAHKRAKCRKAKSKSVYAVPENGLGIMHYEDDM